MEQDLKIVSKAFVKHQDFILSIKKDLKETKRDIIMQNKLEKELAERQLKLQGMTNSSISSNRGGQKRFIRNINNQTEEHKVDQEVFAIVSPSYSRNHTKMGNTSTELNEFIANQDINITPSNLHQYENYWSHKQRKILERIFEIEQKLELFE